LVYLISIFPQLLSFQISGYNIVAASLPKRLGKFPLWQGEVVFMDALEEICKKASFAGTDAFIASTLRKGEDDPDGR